MAKTQSVLSRALARRKEDIASEKRAIADLKKHADLIELISAGPFKIAKSFDKDASSGVYLTTNFVDISLSASVYASKLNGAGIKKLRYAAQVAGAEITKDETFAEDWAAGLTVVCRWKGTSPDGVGYEVTLRAREYLDSSEEGACRKVQVGTKLETKEVPIYEVRCN